MRRSTTVHEDSLQDLHSLALVENVYKARMWLVTHPNLDFDDPVDGAIFRYNDNLAVYASDVIVFHGRDVLNALIEERDELEEDRPLSGAVDRGGSNGVEVSGNVVRKLALPMMRMRLCPDSVRFTDERIEST